MPKHAIWNNTLVTANSIPIDKINDTFTCCTPNCNARMTLCKAGQDDAYFRSIKKSDHIGNVCIKNSIIFKESKYEESNFDLNFAFESMMGMNHSIKNIYRGTTGTQKGTVGGNKNLRIHTLPMLYAMCLSRGKTGSYNGIKIDDLLADNENYNKYKNGIQGYKLVETSKYYQIPNEFAFIMNYPSENYNTNSWVKILFNSENLFNKQLEKLSSSSHIEPIIIAGQWEIVSTQKYHSECTIYSDNQIYFAKEQ